VHNLYLEGITPRSHYRESYEWMVAKLESYATAKAGTANKFATACFALENKFALIFCRVLKSPETLPAHMSKNSLSKPCTPSSRINSRINSRAGIIQGRDFIYYFSAYIGVCSAPFREHCLLTSNAKKIQKRGCEELVLESNSSQGEGGVARVSRLLRSGLLGRGLLKTAFQPHAIGTSERWCGYSPPRHSRASRNQRAKQESVYDRQRDPHPLF
jgi:hypothetical protein